MIEAHDVDSALRYVHHPDVAIVVTAVVRGGNGDEISTEIARRRPGLPVLLVTSHSEARLQRPLDPAHVLRKPFTPSELIAKIRGLQHGRATQGLPGVP